MENAQKVPLFCFFRVFSPFLNRFSWLRYPNVRLEKLRHILIRDPSRAVVALLRVVRL